MYKNDIADTSKMNWYESKAWPPSNATENTANSRMLIKNISDDDLEEIIANLPLDLSEQARSSESPLDLSCKTRKRCADSTDERQFFIQCNEPVEKKLCTGVSETLGPHENSRFKLQKQSLSINSNSPSSHNRNIIRENRQNCLRSTSEALSKVIKHHNIYQCASQQPIQINYVPLSCQANLSKIPQVEVQSARQSRNAQNDKVSIKQRNYMTPQQGHQQRQQTSQNSHFVQTKLVSRSQHQQAHEAQQHQAQRRIVMQQPFGGINTERASSQRQNNVQSRLADQIQLQMQNDAYQYHKQSSEDTLITAQNHNAQIVKKCGGFMSPQHDELHRRHINPNIQQKDLRFMTRSENDTDYRKSCIQQLNTAYSKQQHCSDMQTKILHQKSTVSQQPESINPMQMSNSQYSMPQNQAASFGSRFAHTTRLHPIQSVQRCSPDSTNHSKDIRCEKTECSDKKTQYSPNFNFLANYHKNGLSEYNSSVNAKLSTAGALNRSSDAYMQTHSSSVKSSFSGSNSTLTGANSSLAMGSANSPLAVGKPYTNNARAGSCHLSPLSVSSNVPYSLSNPSLFSCQSNSITSYNGAQRSIVNGTSGMTRTPSVEIIPQLCSEYDRKVDQKMHLSDKQLDSSEFNRKSTNPTKYSARGETTSKKSESVMSHLFSQVEKGVNESQTHCKDVMSHLFTQVENGLNDANEIGISKNIATGKYTTGCITDVYKNRKETMQVEKENQLSGYGESKNFVKSNTSPNVVNLENQITESERYSSPLLISIPTNSNGSDLQNNKNESKQVKCLSKKQLILNAVNKDEGLRKIVNSVVQKPKPRSLSPSDSASKLASHRNCNVSPTFPESPKMPTLSPQQKLPTPEVSPSIVDPPTLDAATPGYRQRPEKLSLLRKPILNSLVSNEKESKLPLPNQSTFSKYSDGSGSKLQEYTGAFGKRPSMLQKIIPVANVAPMVHRSVSEDSDITSQNDTSNTKSNNSILKNIQSSQIGPFSTDIQAYNVLRSPMLSKSKFEDCDIDNSVDNETFNVYFEKSDSRKRLSPLMKKKIFQKHQTQGYDCPLEQADVQSDSPVKQTAEKHKCSTSLDCVKNKRSPSLKQRQCQNKKVVRKLRNTTPYKIRTKRPTEGRSASQPEISTVASSKDTGVKRKETEETGIVVHTKRKAWISLNKARHHMQLRKQNGTKSQNETVVKRSESLRARKRRTHLRKTALKLSKPVNAKRAQALENANTENGGVSTQGKDGGSDNNRDGMWEVTGSGSTLRNGKPKGGLMLKLFFRPKKKRRFTRKTRRRRGGIKLKSDINVNTRGTCNPRAEYLEETQGNRHKEAKLRLKHPRNLTDSRNTQSYIDVTESRTTSFEELSTDLWNETTELIVPEVKRLAVCRDTGETPLHRAARMGHLDVAVYCLKSGTVEVNVKDNAGYTPLHECSVSGHIGIARLLLSYGADVNCSSSQDGIRPIHDAVEHDHMEIVRLLITFGADLTISTYSGKTPVKIARSNKMQLLIKGHLGDLNGFEEDQEESVWDIPSSYLSRGNIIPETNVFSNIPSDPEEEMEVVIFQESQEPTFSMLKLPYTSQNGQKAEDREVVLLRDVTDYFKVNAVAIEKNSGVKSSINISKEQILSNTSSSILYDRILCIPGSACRLLSSQELSQIILKCERRVVRKYVRKNKTLDSNAKMISSNSDSQSKDRKKRKNGAKSPAKVNTGSSVHINVCDVFNDPDAKQINCNSSVRMEKFIDNSGEINENTLKSFKHVNANNNSLNVDYVIEEEQARFGSISDDAMADMDSYPFLVRS